MIASRLQVAVYNRLRVEVVGDFPYVVQVWNRWCQIRGQRHQPFGGMLMQDATCRGWRVPVGACLTCRSVEPCPHDVSACPNCGRMVTEADWRVTAVGATWGEPAHDDPGCRHCMPEDEEIEAARDAAYEQRLDLMREGVEERW